MYDEKFLKSSVALLESELADINTWSVYNDDKYNEEIQWIKVTVTKLKDQMGRKK